MKPNMKNGDVMALEARIDALERAGDKMAAAIRLFLDPDVDTQIYGKHHMPDTISQWNQATGKNGE